MELAYLQSHTEQLRAMTNDRAGHLVCNPLRRE